MPVWKLAAITVSGRHLVLVIALRPGWPPGDVRLAV
jgi:hypothetical protein